MEQPTPALVTFNQHEAQTAAALFERLFPADENGPGAGEIGVVTYVDRALAGAYRDSIETYRLGLAALDRAALQRCDALFADCDTNQQNDLLVEMEQGALPNFLVPPQYEFFKMLRTHLQEGLFSDPAYDGNRDKLGWKFLGHPGVWLQNSAEENLSPEPATKGGIIQSLEDVGYTLGNASSKPADISGYDPEKGAEPPSGLADVVLVGVGGVGGLIAPILAGAGLKVVGLEAGPWYTRRDFVPDELGETYYGRANLSVAKFLSEMPRWRRNEGELTEEASFSLGRMVNGVGGSIIHYSAWLRRYHPHHFEHLTHVRERWGEKVLPAGHTLADWPVSYDDLEPYYTALDYLVGVSGGDEDNPFISRSKPYPMLPLREHRAGRIFHKTTEAMGLHPHPVPVGINSEPYDGRPATNYTAWVLGFGSLTDDKWNPTMTSVPEALATGNFDLRTNCRVIRVVTDGDGHATGVEYVDANGNLRVQEARTVILSGYTFENVRLLLLSGDSRHPEGLGNNEGQVGKHFMTKMFAHVNGYFPDTAFNRHTAPGAQGVVLDDFLAADFDSAAHGFVGGATLGAENGLLPLVISREALPSDVRSWGKSYKDHIRQWQHWYTIRIQPDTLPYVNNFLDLDPRYRDRSGLGLPLMRITYDMRDNEHRLAEWMENKSEEILREMGAAKIWRGPRFTGVLSSHDLGGARMGEDPASSVVDPDLRVHDTPGLYVFSGATFPTCPGINPTHTLWALCYRAAERLVKRLRCGEE